MAAPVPSASPAWLDQQYNNRARIPEHPQILARWQQASALSREKTSCRLDLRYGPLPDQTLDLFPTFRDRAPVLIFVHGGWWRALDKRDHSYVAPSFVYDGAMVVIPNYTLCPAATIETIVLQILDAVAWTWRHAALYGGDPLRIVVAGHSAGAHLAAMALACLWPRHAPDLPEQVVHAALGISGVYDLEPVSRTPFLKADLRLDDASVARLSPVRMPAPAGRLAAVVGAQESEEFLRQNKLIRAAWGRAVVPVCETIPGTHHLDVMHDFASPTGRSHRHALKLLGL